MGQKISELTAITSTLGNEIIPIVKDSSTKSITIRSLFKTREFNIIDYGADPSGLIDSTSTIQAACDAAYTANGKVTGAGTFLVSSTINIRSNADLGTATFNINDASGCPVQWYDATNFTRGQNVIFPKVNNTYSSSEGVWPGNSIGIKIINGRDNVFTVPWIYKFNIGLLLTTSPGMFGCRANTFNLSEISNCKVGIKLSAADTSGYVNENLFIGGWIINWTTAGIHIPGSRGILLDANDHNEVNGNTFIKTSVEGTINEYMIECYGSHNTFLDCRFEGDASVKYSKTTNKDAEYNLILGGYNSQYIGFVNDTAAALNFVWTVYNMQNLAAQFRDIVGIYDTTYNSTKPNRLDIYHKGISGTAVTPAGDVGIRLKSASEGAYIENCSAQIIARNTISNNYASWLAFQTHGTSSSTNYIDALKVGPVGEIILLPAGVPTYNTNAEASIGGLSIGRLYCTSTGHLMMRYL